MKRGTIIEALQQVLIFFFSSVTKTKNASEKNWISVLDQTKKQVVELVRKEKKKKKDNQKFSENMQSYMFGSMPGL